MENHEPELEKCLEEHLESWTPPEYLLWATNELNLSDAFVFERMMSEGRASSHIRVTHTPGVKTTSSDEDKYRKLDFFRSTQGEWSAEFRSRLEAKIDPDLVSKFLNGITSEWIDGRKARHDSQIMQSLKASIQNYDREIHGSKAQEFVLEVIPNTVAPLFDVYDMRNLYEINSSMLEAYMGEYLVELNSHLISSISDLIVRRGIFAEKPTKEHLVELNLLSSYSLSLSASEQFAVTYTSRTKAIGEATIIGCAFPEIQNRVIAFAPFIPGMKIDQLELILPPPVNIAHLTPLKSWGEVTEYVFKTHPDY